MDNMKEIIPNTHIFAFLARGTTVYFQLLGKFVS